MFIQIQPALNCAQLLGISREIAAESKEKIAADKSYYIAIRKFPVITETCGEE